MSILVKYPPKTPLYQGFDDQHGAVFRPKTLGLWHFDGANGETGPFIDSSSYRRHLTRVGTGASLTTTTPVFGATCLTCPSDYMTGATGGVMEQIGTGDFCFEVWLKFSTVSLEGGANRRVCQLPFLIYIETTGRITWANGATFSSTNLYNTTNWHALVLERVGNVVTMYKDGAVENSGVDMSSFAAGRTFFGTGGVGRYAGTADEMRLSRVARYGGAHTTPAAAFISD